MRKSEKLSDAIGEISDDIIEEAYTYKPKHDMHQRKASFKWGAAVAVLAMLVLAGVGVSVGEELPFPAWNNCFQIYGEGCKGGLPYPGNSGNTAGNPGRSGITCGKRRNGKNRKKEVIKDIITKKTLYALAKRTDVLCRIRNMIIMQNC